MKSNHTPKRDFATWVIAILFVGVVVLILAKRPEPSEPSETSLIPPLVLECDRHLDTLCVEYHEVTTTTIPENWIDCLQPSTWERPTTTYYICLQWEE